MNLENARIDLDLIKENIENIKKVTVPDFVRFETDFDEIERIVRIYWDYKNIILIGNGGAINSFRGFYFSLAKYFVKKNIEIVNTVEPDYISGLKRNYAREDTLIVVVSKSGTNPTALEAMFAFWDYKKLVVCTEGLGALYKIVKREKIDYLKYPSHQEFPYLDDRHTGISASGLVPAALFGMDIKEIYRGAKEMHVKCSPHVGVEENSALKLAAVLFVLEKKGFDQIFCPVYSTRLVGFLPLIIQFMHETVCKEGKGQTIFGDLAPESHHHTNQRFFGGKKNILGLFLTVKQDDEKTYVEIKNSLNDIPIRGGLLRDFEMIPYHKLLEFEFKGVFQDAVEREIPVINLELEGITARGIGQFLGLLQYLAFYSAHLRGVNPLGQPEVERAKEISFEFVKNCKS